MSGPEIALSPAHRLWRLLPQSPRRLAFAALTRALAPRAPRAPLVGCHGVVVGGEFTRASGLGEGARLMRRALSENGIACSAVLAGLGIEEADLEDPSLVPLSATPPEAPLILHVNPPSLPAALLRLGRAGLGRRRRIGYFAWELVLLPLTWKLAGNLVHEIWVPSRFTAAAMREAYPQHEVKIVPHPLVAERSPVPQEHIQSMRTRLGVKEGAVLIVTSLSLASGRARKNPDAAIAAFKAAFGARSDRRLVIKLGHAAHAPAEFASLRALADGAENIQLLTETLSHAENRALLAAADIVLSLHRSEGFGLVPAEAMLLGRAVIATDYGGSTDFIDQSCAMPIPYRLVAARDERGTYAVPGAEWAEADHEASVAALRSLAEDPDRRAKLGGSALVQAQKCFSAAPLLTQVASLLRQVRA